MIARFVEVTNQLNYGKVVVARFTPEEWTYRSQLPDNNGRRLLPSLGWGDQRLQTYLVMDLQTGEGALFLLERPGAVQWSLNDKHQIWVCPMFEPFLIWLERWALENGHPSPDTLPGLVELTEQDAPSAFRGYRRQRKADGQLPGGNSHGENLDSGQLVHGR